jgi:DNA-directed RNA polymerase subunit RPC12/RpoP
MAEETKLDKCPNCGVNKLYLKSEELYGAEFKDGKISLVESYGEEYKRLECDNCSHQIFSEEELADKEVEYNF